MAQEAQEPGTGKSAADGELLDRLGTISKAVYQELGKVIVGQRRTVESIMIALLCRGHCLLEGVPGLAKTLMVSSLARVLRLRFNRVQFTPDLMPSDIVGTDILDEDPETRKRHFRFIEGPVFTNLLLADEINRTPPKTQAALLESMQERQVTAGGKIRALPRPFFVLATQNPVELEGTYSLPEAQLDRFMFNVILDYPGPEDELEILRRASDGRRVELEQVMDAQTDLLPMQDLMEDPAAIVRSP